VLLPRQPVLCLGLSRTVSPSHRCPSRRCPTLERSAIPPPCTPPNTPRVSVVEASTGALVTTLPTLNVFQLGFSPLGTYIITWQLPTKDADGNANKNLKVWRTVPDESETAQERAVVGEYVQKSQTGWNLQYSADEKFCARAVTNEVQFFQSNDLRNPWNKLRVEGVTDFALSQGKNHSVAVFVPERKVCVVVVVDG
jgi:translation initiation factor 2A